MRREGGLVLMPNPARQSYNPQIDRDIDAKVSRHLQLLYAGTNNHDAAIGLLSQQFRSLASQLNFSISGSSATPLPSSGSTSSGVSARQAAVIAQQQIMSTLGGVNDPSVDYTLQSSDYGSAVIMNAASPTTVTLNARLTARFFSTIQNAGSAPTTLMPGTGTINGGSSLALSAGMVVGVYFDGANWFATNPQYSFSDISGTVAATQLPVPTVTSLGGVQASTPTPSEWVSEISPSGVPVLSQPAFSDLSGNLATSQLPLAGISVTVMTAQLTPTGAQGSLTFTNGLLTAQTPAT